MTTIAKGWAMSEPILRHLTMLGMIPALPRKITAGQLHGKLAAQTFDIDIRSIERDLHKLSRMFPLISDEAKPAGWSWSERDKALTFPPMNAEAALVYELLSRHLKPAVPPSMLAAMEPEFAQARRTLNDLRESPVGRWNRKIAVLPFGQQLIPPQVKPEVMSVVNDALLNSRQFDAHYRGMGDKQAKSFVVNPLGLVYREGVFYLVATIRDYTDPRHLALHRMTKAISRAEPAIVPKEFDFDHYVREEKSFDYPFGKKIKLELKVDDWLARHLDECRLAVDQQIRPIPGGEQSRIVAMLDDTDQLFWWLRSLGPSLEVLKPLSLRKKMAESVESLSRIYR
jgi:predicted DNA-binding transcriptional regulator YafY